MSPTLYCCATRAHMCLHALLLPTTGYSFFNLVDPDHIHEIAVAVRPCACSVLRVSDPLCSAMLHVCPPGRALCCSGHMDAWYRTTVSPTEIWSHFYCGRSVGTPRVRWLYHTSAAVAKLKAGMHIIRSWCETRPRRRKAEAVDFVPAGEVHGRISAAAQQHEA